MIWRNVIVVFQLMMERGPLRNIQLENKKKKKLLLKIRDTFLYYIVSNMIPNLF